MPKKKIERQYGEGIEDSELEKKAPEMDYNDSLKQDDHDKAFMYYFRYRNISEVSRLTDIPKSTIYHWRKKYEWDNRINSIEKKGRVKIDRSLEEMQSQHQSVYRFLQARTLQELKDGSYVQCPKCKTEISHCPECAKEGKKVELPKKLQFKSVGEAARVMDTAIKGERLVSGLTTSNVGVQVIQSLSDEFSQRLGQALGRLLEGGVLTEYIMTRVVNEFSMIMNEKPITVGQLKAGAEAETTDAEFEEV